MTDPASIRVKIYADGADVAGIAEMSRNPLIRGFTTNPTLMRKAGVTDYRAFALEVLDLVDDRPVSFEVFSDEFEEMVQQASEIASWGDNVYVKIPVTDTRGQFSGEVIRLLSARGVQVNVTAVFTVEQVERVAAALDPGVPSVVSVFAGRIADAGCDPVPIVKASLEVLDGSLAELIWASPRELLNLVQAEEVGCDIITMTNDLLAKLPLLGRDLTEFSLDTVRMFHDDAATAGYRIEVTDQVATGAESRG